MMGSRDPDRILLGSFEITTMASPRQKKANRANSLKSTGPKNTDNTKYNALRHGLCAATLTLPGENPEVALQLIDDWEVHYGPRGPAERYFADECIRASIQSGRAHDAYMGELTKQVRGADDDWLKKDQKRLADHVELLKQDPASAVRELRDSASGCRWLIERWEALDLVLATKGNWCEVDRYDAVRLLGFRPEPEFLRWHPDAWYVRMLNLACHPCPGSAAIPFLFDEERLPERFLSGYQEGRIPPPAEEARPVLRAMIADRLAELRQREVYLQTRIDGPDRAEAPRRALVLRDATDARLFLRYQSEARSTFHRAYAALIKAIDRRLEQEAEAVADDPQGRADAMAESAPTGWNDEVCEKPPTCTAAPAAGPASGLVENPPTAAGAVSRNEANSAGKSSQVTGTSEVSGEACGAIRARSERAWADGDGAMRREDPFGAEMNPDRGTDFVPIPIVGPLS
jgi:hypothetical protein